MSIEFFIREDILVPRLAKRGVLMVCDTEHRYRGLRAEMQEEHFRLVDAIEIRVFNGESASLVGPRGSM